MRINQASIIATIAALILGAICGGAIVRHDYQRSMNVKPVLAELDR